jgi:hypothetical protein
MKKMLIGLLAISMLAGCIEDEFNTDLIVDDFETTAGVAIPLAKSKVTMADILSDQTDMVKYDGERIILFQENEAMEYVGINDFFRVTAQKVKLPFIYSVFNHEDEYSEPLSLNFTIPSATITVMELAYSISAQGNDLEAPLLLSLTIPIEDGDDRTVELEVRNNQSTVKSFSGDRISLTGNKLNLQASIKPLNGGNGFSNTPCSIDIELGDLSLSYVKGTMGENKVTMDEGNYDLDFDVLNDIPGDIEFDGPKVSIIIDNGTPFMGEIKPDLSGVLNDNSTINLSSESFNMVAKADGEESTRSRHTLHKGNSDVKSFIAKTPDVLKYAGELTLNPGGVVNTPIELSDEDRIYIGYGFEVPLELKLNANLEEEVVELDDIDMLDDLTKASLIFNVINNLPIGASATVNFYDEETASVIETMDIELAKSAKVDSEGKVIEPGEAVLPVELSEYQVESLRNSEELRITVRLNTTDYEKGQTVVFEKKNSLEMQLVIRGKVEYNN